MKRIFTFVIVAVTSLFAFAQYGPMRFAGPSKFGVASLNTWQQSESDTIVFSMTSATQADITLPAMTYDAMGLTIPSFTIHGLTFTVDSETHNAVFADQTYAEVVTVDGEEKSITGSSFTAEYKRADNSFVINTVMSYGRMPFPLTFTIDATYVAPTTGVSVLHAEDNSAFLPAYDLCGRKTSSVLPGRIYIKNGKKYISLH